MTAAQASKRFVVFRESCIVKIVSYASLCKFMLVLEATE